MAKKLSFWKRQAINSTSDDKKFINAIITSDTLYAPAGKKRKKFKVYTYAYAAVIFIFTALSLSLLAVSNKVHQDYNASFSIVEILAFIVLGIDLFLRWYTSEVRMRKGNYSYFLFPFTLVGVLLIASMMPSLYLINEWGHTNIAFFETMKGLKFLRVFRLILLANLVPGLAIFKRVLTKEASTLYIVFTIVLITILVFGLVMYNVEGPDSHGARKAALDNYNSLQTSPLPFDDKIFDGTKTTQYAEIRSGIKIGSFLDAIYFSTVALTTIGFGDISPITSLGKIIVMVMSIIGIAVLAIPSGIIAGGFISEIKELRKTQKPKTKKSR